MRRPRFRLRTLLILVAVVAVGLGGVLWMDRRAHHFRRIATEYRDMAKLLEISAATGSRQFGPDAVYCRALQRKYEYAASHPWLPVAPDQTEP